MAAVTFKSLFVLLLFCSTAQSVDVLFEDFEDATVTYTTSTAEFTDGSGDFFTRTDGSNIGSFYQVTGFDGNSYFAAMDIDAEGASLPVTMDFTGLDITGLENLEFSGLFAEDDDGSNQDWDVGDYVHVDYQIDGGGYQPLLWFESVPDGDNFNAVPAVDTDFDGDGDGAELSSTFALFAAPILETGTTLDLRITFNLDSGNEDIAMDDIRVTGDLVTLDIADVSQLE